MKPLLFPDGTIMRSMDDFKLVGKPDKVRIRFLKEDVDGKPIFVSELPVDNDAVFAEQMPFIRKDLQSIRDAVLDKVRGGQVVEGLQAGLEYADEVLARTLPHTDGVTDELMNEVLVFHPRP